MPRCRVVTPESVPIQLSDGDSVRAVKEHNANVAQAESNGIKSPYSLKVDIPPFGKQPSKVIDFGSLK